MYRRLSLALAVAVIAAACNQVIDPSKNTVVTYTGTLQPGSAGTGQQISSFSVSKTGEIVVTVTSITPSVPLGTLFGVILGQVSSNQCLVWQNNQFATVGTAAIDQQITPGTWCVVIHDPRNIFTVPETFEVKVSHP